MQELLFSDGYHLEVSVRPQTQAGRRIRSLLGSVLLLLPLIILLLLFRQTLNISSLLLFLFWTCALFFCYLVLIIGGTNRAVINILIYVLASYSGQCQ
jgi:NAD/NADP transhydrogenase beta subunit